MNKSVISYNQTGGRQTSCYETEKKREIIAYLYEKESDVWHKYVHKNGGTCEQNIEDTLKTITGETMFVVKAGDEIAGFFVKFENETGIALDGFHVAEKFREPVFLNYFWLLVKKKLGDNFSTGIYSRNDAAIRHLLKQGFILQSHKIFDEKLFFILTFKT